VKVAGALAVVLLLTFAAAKMESFAATVWSWGMRMEIGLVV
jgi:hypothetical protein